MDQADKLAKIKELAETSLFFLCTEMLGYKDWDLVHNDVEILLAKPSAKKAILLPRGHLKTSIVTVGYTVMRILQNKNIRVLICNQVWDKAREMLGEIKDQLDDKSPLPHLFGHFKSNKWNSDSIVISQRTRAVKEPTVATTGVEAETTGGHYDLIILDDLMGLQNCQTPEQRAKVKRFRRSMIDLLEPNGTLVEIGTRWHLDDTFGDLLEKEMKYYDVMVRQVVEDGKVIFPLKFNQKFNKASKKFEHSKEPCMDFIDHLKATHTPEEFNSQYMNNPVESENQIFKYEYFKHWDKRPEGLFVTMTVDLAISQRANADYTAIVVTGMDKDHNIYVLDYIRGHWFPKDIVDNVFQMESKWKPSVVGMEINGFQVTLKNACEEEMRVRRHHFPITPIKTGPQKSKENKIKSLEPFYRTGKVFHAAWMKKKDLEFELIAFPKSKNDDLIDALSMSLDFLVPGNDKQKPVHIPEGSFEWYQQLALKASQPYKDFFNHG